MIDYAIEELVREGEIEAADAVRKLQAENERLKSERNCAIISRDMAWDKYEESRKENAKLRCFALHLFREYAKEQYRKLENRAFDSKTIRHCKRWYNINFRLCNEYAEARIKAKKELKEGK